MRGLELRGPRVFRPSGRHERQASAATGTIRLPRTLSPRPTLDPVLACVRAQRRRWRAAFFPTHSARALPPRGGDDSRCEAPCVPGHVLVGERPGLERQAGAVGQVTTRTSLRRRRLRGRTVPAPAAAARRPLPGDAQASRCCPCAPAARVVHVDGLDLGEELDGRRALLARAHARGLACRRTGAAPRRPGVPLLTWTMPASMLVHEAEGAGGVAGEDRGGQAEAHAVGRRQRLLEVPHADHRDHGAEDLLLRDPHARSSRGRTRWARRSSRGRGRRPRAGAPPQTQRARLPRWPISM